MIGTLETRAKQFATRAHYGQFRKDEITPYINHCAGVVNLLKGIGVTDEDILCAAWLHDTIEDCEITKEQIEQEFNSNIARIVSALTRDVNRESYKDRIRNADYSIQIVKLADTVHNCSEMDHPKVSKSMKMRKVEDCRKLYLGLSKNICPKFYDLLLRYTKDF